MRLALRTTILIVLVSTLLSGAVAQTRVNVCGGGGEIDTTLLSALTHYKLYQAYRHAMEAWLEAVANRRTQGTGIVVSDRQAAIAQAHLNWLRAPYTLSDGTRGGNDLVSHDLVFDEVRVRFEPPVKWVPRMQQLRKQIEERFCNRCVANKGTGNLAPAYWFHADLLIASGLCVGNHQITQSGGVNRPLPDRNWPKKIRTTWSYLAAPDRYDRQLRYLRQSRNRPFRKSEKMFQLLYVDFFLTSLKNGDTSFFAREFFGSDSNGLQRDFEFVFTRLGKVMELFQDARLATERAVDHGAQQ